jgi:hypothetical protein
MPRGSRNTPTKVTRSPEEIRMLNAFQYKLKDPLNPSLKADKKIWKQQAAAAPAIDKERSDEAYRIWMAGVIKAQKRNEQEMIRASRHVDSVQDVQEHKAAATEHATSSKLAPSASEADLHIFGDSWTN